MHIHDTVRFASRIELGIMAALLLASSPGCGDGDSSPSASGATDDATASGSTTGTGAGGGSAGPGSGRTGTGATGTGGTGGAEVPPPPPGIEFLDLIRPIDLTPDGTVALIEDVVSLEVEAYLYDTVAGELAFETKVGDPLHDFSTGISATGRISALHGVPVQAGVWTEANAWVDLESMHPAGCDQAIAGAWDVSADGSVVVGMVWNGCSPEAFRWSDAGGEGVYTPLEVLGSSFEGSSNAPSNRATVVSDDGSTVAGFAQNGPIDRAAAVWHADGSGELLDPNEADWPGEVLSISADGKTMAGTRGYDGFVWTAEDGMQSLGKPASAEAVMISYPNAVAAGGALIFGAFGDPWMTLPEAFVWTEAEGMRKLVDIVVAGGLEIPEGWVLTNVLAASADGSVALGSAYDADGNSKSFVLRLPVSAYGLADR
jgi:hypothetical protein